MFLEKGGWGFPVRVFYLLGLSLCHGARECVNGSTQPRLLFARGFGPASDRVAPWEPVQVGLAEERHGRVGQSASCPGRLGRVGEIQVTRIFVVVAVVGFGVDLDVRISKEEHLRGARGLAGSPTRRSAALLPNSLKLSHSLSLSYCRRPRTIGSRGHSEGETNTEGEH